MKNQTVEQRFHEQQMINGQVKPKHVAESAITPPQKRNVQKLFQSTAQALQEAHQSVRQAQTANPSLTALLMADQSLTQATQFMQQLQTAQPEFSQSLSKGTQQQLKQLDYQIEKAASTLQSIQQTIQPQS